MQKTKTIRKEFLLVRIVVLAVSLSLYVFLPVPYTLYAQPNDGTLSASDPVTINTPLQQCIDQNLENVTGIDLLLATYGRINTNTNHFEIFSIQNNQKIVLFQKDFSSQNVKDNDYFSIDFPEIPGTQKLCFLLTSPDGTASNAITYWLNSQSEPVLKVRSTVALHKAIEQISGASRFHLPIWLAVALCLVYLAANISALFLIWYDSENFPEISKAPSPHPRRTRQKRV